MQKLALLGKIPTNSQFWSLTAPTIEVSVPPTVTKRQWAMTFLSKKRCAMATRNRYFPGPRRQQTTGHYEITQ